MSTRLVWAIIALTLSACLAPNSVQCGDRVCPASTLCDQVHDLCVVEEQTTACDALQNGATCTAAGTRGICDEDYCVPGCGDGAQGENEDCDDGNFNSHDGCSSACIDEAAGWTLWQDAWIPRRRHAAAYDVAGNRLVVFGGTDKIATLADLWQRDQLGNWTQLPSPPLPKRFDAAIAYDPANQRIVVFGGADSVALGDTWQLQGTTWTQIAGPGPAARNGAALVFDPGTGTLVLFGGLGQNSTFFNDTWRLDGNTWTQLSPTTSPPARANHGMAVQTGTNEIVMFGGQAFSNWNDTWRFTAGTWTEVTFPLYPYSPSPRRAAAFAYSPQRQRFVLFGGLDDNFAAASDTWELDMTASAPRWEPVFSATTPPSRAWASLVDDPGFGLVLVAGGRGHEGATPLEDVWRYNNASWSETSTTLAPSPRMTAMAYDAQRKRIVMFGGSDIDGITQDDTWTFDGDRWTHLNVTRPWIRAFHSMTYDATHDRVVMFGGGPFTPYRTDTWQWDGAAWSQRGDGPSGRVAAAMSDNRRDGTIVLVGGRTAEGVVLTDTWENDGINWSQSTAATQLSQAAAYGAAMAYDVGLERTILFDAEGTTWAYVDRAWTRLDMVESPPPRIFGSLIFNPTRGRLLLYGGSASSGELYADAWELAGDTWHRVLLAGTQPPPRAMTGGFAPLPTLRSVVMFGGGTDRLGDTWLMKYVSITPDELCANGEDDDGDKQVDAIDPDCM